MSPHEVFVEHKMFRLKCRIYSKGVMWLLAICRWKIIMEIYPVGTSISNHLKIREEISTFILSSWGLFGCLRRTTALREIRYPQSVQSRIYFAVGVDPYPNSQNLECIWCSYRFEQNENFTSSAHSFMGRTKHFLHKICTEMEIQNHHLRKNKMSSCVTSY